MRANFNRDLQKTQILATKKLTPPSFFEIMELWPEIWKLSSLDQS